MNRKQILLHVSVAVNIVNTEEPNERKTKRITHRMILYTTGMNGMLNCKSQEWAENIR